MELLMEEQALVKKQERQNKKNDGFSFLELIAVLVIIAILASVAVPVYTEQMKSARATEAQVTIGAIKNATKMYEQKYGSLPNDVAVLESKGFIKIDPATVTKWTFEFSKNRNELQLITAKSTNQMPGGEGNTITFDARTGKWSGYGQASE